MMKNILWFLLFVPFVGNSQNISNYSSSELYDAPGGLYEKDSLRSIYIDFYDDDYHSVLVQSFFDDPSFRLLATVTVNGEAHDSVGVRYKGNSTFCLANDVDSEKLPINIDMNYVVSGQKLLEYKKLKLGNAWLDATFIREHVASEIYQNYVPTPESNLMKVYVQGAYVGVYFNTESINKQFAEKHFGDNDGPLFKCDNAAVFCGNNTGLNPYQPSLRWIIGDSATYYDTYDMKSPNGWAELLEAMETIDTNPSELDSVLNVDRVLWNFAVNTVICNFDTYNSYYVHNYYIYQTEDGLFQMLPWDLDNSFLNALLGEDIFTPIGPDHPTHFDPYYGSDFAARPLTNILFNDPFYRKVYNAHIRTVMDEIDLDYIQSRVDVMQDLAADAVAEDDNKLFPTSEFSNNVENDLAFWLWGGFGFGGVISTYTERINFLVDNAEIMQAQPEMGIIEHAEGYILAEVSNANGVELLATTSPYNSKFQSFTMVDDGTNGDATAGDGIYTSPLPFQPTTDDIKFYIRAQNDDALRLSPERAEYEFYVYSDSTTTGTVYHTPLLPILKVYPNPASGIVNIEYEALNESFTLYSTTGTEILSGVLNNGNTVIDLSELPNNIYILRVGNTMRKIVKTD